METEPVIVTEHGRPVAALMPIENPDRETVALSTTRGSSLSSSDLSAGTRPKAESRPKRCADGCGSVPVAPAGKPKAYC